MSGTSFMKDHRIRRFSLSIIITIFFVSGSFIPVSARSDPREEITSRILSLFPSYSGKVRELEGDAIVIQGAPNTTAQIGAYLLVNKGVLVRVVSVDGQEVRAVYAGKNGIQRGDPVSGWPRPLPVALVPMSREALQFLLKYTLPKGDLAPVRTEDVLTAMIQNNYDDFYSLEKMDAAALGADLKTSLILQVGLLSGFGTNLLQFQPRWVEDKDSLASFSVMLPGGAVTASRPLLPAAAFPPERSQQRASLPLVQGTAVPLPLQPGTAGESAPALAMTEAHGNTTPSSLPSLPSLSGFDQPTRWVRILQVKEQVLSITGGSFSAPEKREIALALPGEIRIYSLRKNKLKEREGLENSQLDTLFWLETWDVNGDGQDEIIGDTDEGVVLITQGQREPSIVHREQGIVIRRLGDRLFAQKLSDLRAGHGPVYTVAWTGRDWRTGESPSGLQSANLFSLVSSSAEAPLFVGEDHRLNNGHGSISEEEVGQSNTPALLEIDLPLFARALSLPEGSLLIKNRAEGWPHLNKMKYSNGGEVLLLPGQGPLMTSPPFRGYISDLCIYDLDGDGTGEIFVSQRVSSLARDTSAVLRYGAAPQQEKR